MGNSERSIYGQNTASPAAYYCGDHLGAQKVLTEVGVATYIMPFPSVIPCARLRPNTHNMGESRYYWFPSRYPARADRATSNVAQASIHSHAQQYIFILFYLALATTHSFLRNMHAQQFFLFQIPITSPSTIPPKLHRSNSLLRQQYGSNRIGTCCSGHSRPLSQVHSI